MQACGVWVDSFEFKLRANLEALRTLQVGCEMKFPQPVLSTGLSNKACSGRAISCLHEGLSAAAVRARPDAQR